MDSINLMVDEHKNIKRMLAVIRKMCYMVLKDQPVNYDDFFKVIDFIRNYADGHHHGKEEALLFDMMVNELGPLAEKLVKQGMYVEHDMGRLHNQELEAALHRVLEGDEESKLDLIANAISYSHLLNRHIDKEDTAVYVYARNNLSKESLEELDRSSEEFEQKAIDNHVQAKYMELIESMEKKYNSITI